MFVRKLLLFSVSLFICCITFAGTVKGKIISDKTGEPLVGASVQLAGQKTYSTYVNLDGTYTFKNVQAGSYTLSVSFVGYSSDIQNNIIVKDETAPVLMNVQLKDAGTQLKEVVVAAHALRETDNSVRRLEKNSDIVENILSQKTIELSPDVTVANAIQRMSGVTIERSSSGEGRYAIIRGMEQRYNSTLINGIKIPSPDDKFRYVPMDIFPSELLERLEVIKSLTPSMEGDAIGGTMNLVMKSAPDKMLFTVNAAGGYNTLFSNRDFSSFDHSVISKKSPGEISGSDYKVSPSIFSKANLAFSPKSSPINSTAGATFGNRYFNKRLGFIISGSYQNIFRGSNSDFFKPNEQPLPNNIPQFSDFLFRQYSTRNERFGVNNKFDYVINSNNKISLYNLYVHQDEFQSRYTVDSSAAANVGTFSILNRSRWNIQSIYNSTLHGDHTISKSFAVNWSLVYSRAKNSIPDLAEYEITNSVTNAANGSKGNVNTMTRRWQHNSDRDWSAYLDFHWAPKVFNTKVDFSFGGLGRLKKRENFMDDYGLTSVVNNGTAQAFTNIYDAQWKFKGSDFVNPSYTNTANTYNIKEDIAAGYVQAKWMLTNKLQVLGGVRAEYTYQDYFTQLPPTLDKKYGNINYTDLLPSLHFKYSINAKQNLRLSYYKAISRPGFGDLIPSNNPGEYYDEGGNPYVKHSRADNFDVRYEWFGGAADQVLIGSFYKLIKNPIEYGLISYGTTGKVILQPSNFSDSSNNGNAINYGFEAVVTKYIGKFGVSANYTYTKSSITTSKLVKTSIGGTEVTQTRPLQGQADHIGNVSLLYKDPQIGFDVQLAFVYTGKRIVQVSRYYGLDYWQRAFTQLDFSMEKRIVKKLSFYAKVTNLTNSPRKIDILQPLSIVAPSNMPPEQEGDNKILVQKDIYNVSFLTGLRFKL